MFQTFRFLHMCYKDVNKKPCCLAGEVPLSIVLLEDSVSRILKYCPDELQGLHTGISHCQFDTKLKSYFFININRVLPKKKIIQQHKHLQASSSVNI